MQARLAESFGTPTLNSETVEPETNNDDARPGRLGKPIDISPRDCRLAADVGANLSKEDLIRSSLKIDCKYVLFQVNIFLSAPFFRWLEHLSLFVLVNCRIIS